MVLHGAYRLNLKITLNPHADGDALRVKTLTTDNNGPLKTARSSFLYFSPNLTTYCIFLLLRLAGRMARILLASFPYTLNLDGSFMIDSNAIANLQMLMNTGDGRHAVLAEILQADTFPESEKSSHDVGIKDIPPLEIASRKGSPEIEIPGSQIKRVHRLRNLSGSNHLHSRLTDNVVATLDRLSKEEKAPLIQFAEGLAYQYNNLFMAIVGYISIAMFSMRLSNVEYKRLRDSEEFILNTGMLLRLLIDVLGRSDNIQDTIYPIDLSDNEISNRILSSQAKQSSTVPKSDNDLTAEEILQIISTVISEKIEKVLLTVFKNIQKVFPRKVTANEYDQPYPKVREYILRGIKMTESMNEYAENIYSFVM